MVLGNFLGMIEGNFLAEPDLTEGELSDSFFELNFNGTRIWHELGLKIFLFEAVKDYELLFAVFGNYASLK